MIKSQPNLIFNYTKVYSNKWIYSINNQAVNPAANVFAFADKAYYNYVPNNSSWSLQYEHKNDKRKIHRERHGDRK